MVAEQKHEAAEGPKRESKEDVEMELEDTDYDNAVSFTDTRPEEAIRLFKSILDRIDMKGKEAKLKEESILQLAKLYAKRGMTNEFKHLFISIRPFFSTLHKSRTAKIVRQLIDTVSTTTTTTQQSQQSLSLQAELCENAIEWCTAEKRTFLKQRIQTRLASILVSQQHYSRALELIKQLVHSVKAFDDKLLLVEIYLIESRCHLQLKNLPKSKGALTAARSNANSIYCPPTLQSEIDLQAGILCSHEQDYKTAYSYFYEAYEGFNTTRNTPAAIRAIKYMILSKIMTGQYDEVQQIVQGKAGVKYGAVNSRAVDDTSQFIDGQKEIESMKLICEAYKQRDVNTFQVVYDKYKPQLHNDPVIQAHLQELKSKLQESNLLRLIEPYSRVEISHIAKLIDLSREQVEKHLSAMILDGKLSGVIDQNTDVLIVFQATSKDKTLQHGLNTINQLHNVVNQLYKKAQALHQ